MNFYWEGFRTFFKIGCFTLGGGYAMIPLIQQEVVDRKRWLTEEEFVDTMSLAQTLPGVFAVNFSIYIGRKLRGFKGSLALSLGTILPSFLIILLIALCFHNYSQWHWLESVFKGIRPAVVALIAVPCIRLWKTAQIKMATIWLPISTILLVCLVKMSPILIILCVVVGAYITASINQFEKHNRP